MLECRGVHHAACPDTESRYMRLRGHGYSITSRLDFCLYELETAIMNEDIRVETILTELNNPSLLATAWSDCYCHATTLSLESCSPNSELNVSQICFVVSYAGGKDSQ